MSMSLTSAADYAMRAMVYVASLPDSTVILRSHIADAQNIPSSFMAKILRRLVQARLLRSSRGVRGGFHLARPPAEITLLDIVEAIDGPVSLTRCSTDCAGCGLAPDCPASLVWPRVQELLRNTLRSLTLEDLAMTLRRNGRVSALPTNGLDEATSAGSGILEACCAARVGVMAV